METNKTQFSAREILIFLSIKFDGDNEKILDAIQKKLTYPSSEVSKTLENVNLDSCLTILDDDYPLSLKNCYKSPIVLFINGDKSLLWDKNIEALIGTRHPSGYGLTCTEKYINESCKDKVMLFPLSEGTCVSALAAHLNNNGKAIVCLASGFNAIYPSKYEDLINKTLKIGGLVLSEFPSNSVVKKENFPLRNRLVAGISKQLTCMEVERNSGSTITIAIALEGNTEVHVLPVTFDSQFCNNILIAEGAQILLS